MGRSLGNLKYGNRASVSASLFKTFPNVPKSILSGQITKAAAHDDDAIVAVMKEVRNLLLNLDGNEGIVKYNPDQPRDESGRFSSGGGGMGRSPRIGKKEAARVSSGILTDHPEYQAGETRSYFYGEYYYQFAVRGPGDYQFNMRLKIVGNEDAIYDLEGREK